MKGIVFDLDGPFRSRRGAFTLVELLVVIVMLAVLAFSLIPTLAKSRPDSKAFQCMNNARQLCNAWRMYADDNHDSIVLASDDGGTSNPLNQYAWTLAHMDLNPNNQANWNTNVDIVVRPLWPYTGRNASIYRCPSDQSYVVVSGIAKPRVRSESMNLFLGGFGGTTGGWAYLNAYRIYLKTTDLVAPVPSGIFVFLDQRPENVNWGNFMTDMTGYSPNQPNSYAFSADIPGAYHNLGCTFSFADGRVAIKRWQDPRTTPQISVGSFPDSTPSPNNPDIAWLQDHSTRPK
jgi:prepilin-type N-terminal cleavage/methylation domain-containing protein/prepilin-type processing-associated H-X9-DG protein